MLRHYPRTMLVSRIWASSLACSVLPLAELNWILPVSATSLYSDACFLSPGSAPCPEVVVSPPFVYIPLTKSIIRKDIAVAAQNCWVKKGGAFTGEVRYDRKAARKHSSDSHLS